MKDNYKKLQNDFNHTNPTQKKMLCQLVGPVNIRSKPWQGSEHVNLFTSPLKLLFRAAISMSFIKLFHRCEI